MGTIINQDTYILLMRELCNNLPKKTNHKGEEQLDYDAIVCLKRSGFIMGAFLSNKYNLPLFTNSEYGSIPVKFNKLLIVDDKTFSGKSVRKIVNRLRGREVYVATLVKQGAFEPHFHCLETNEIIKMWYEI